MSVCVNAIVLHRLLSVCGEHSVYGCDAMCMDDTLCMDMNKLHVCDAMSMDGMVTGHQSIAK